VYILRVDQSALGGSPTRLLPLDPRQIRMFPLPRSLKGRIKGALALQPLFERLFRLSLTGMNYGRGGDLSTSGEMSLLDWLRERHRQETSGRPFVVFDVGANVGAYSTAVLDHFGDDVVVHAFEPSEAAYGTLVQRLGSERRVCLSNVALGREEGKLRLYSETPGSTTTSAYRESLETWSVETVTEEVAVVRSLTSYCESVGVTEIDLLKIDVEGHELAVLEGALPLIRSGSIRSIQWEFGACHLAARVFFHDFVATLGPEYEIYRLVRNGVRQISYSPLLEIYETANFLADLGSYGTSRDGATSDKPN
jgi:FkbM family methyltransferase